MNLGVGERHQPRSRIVRIVVLAALFSACGDPAEDVAPAISSDSTLVAAVARPAAERFERSFVFLSNRQDSLLSAGWTSDAASRPDGVDRTGRGVVTLAGTGQIFYQHSATTSPSDVAWRVLPDTAMRILVGESDGIEQLVFESATPPRHLSTPGHPERVDHRNRRGDAAV